jgi:hypothetical protein
MKNINTGILSGRLASVSALNDKNGWKSCYFELEHKKEWKDKSGNHQERVFKNNFKADNDLAEFLQTVNIGIKVVIQYKLESYENASKDGSKVYTNTSIIAESLEVCGIDTVGKTEKEEAPF